MKNKVLILLVVLLVISLGSAYAENVRRLGTAGAQELRIPIGSRGTSMGGAIISDVSGVESIFWNPAGLAGMAGTEVMFSYQPYIADIDVNFVGAATNLGDFGTLAVGAKIVSIGDIEETTDYFPDGTGRIFNPTLSVLTLTYARELTYRVSFGITGSFIHEDIFEAKASGMAFDVGFIYNPGWNGLKVGMAIKNYGTEMSFDGIGFNEELDGRPARANSDNFDLPSSFNLGLSYNFYENERNLAMVTGNFMSNNYSNDLWQGGFEYTFDRRYSLRGGYNYSAQDDYLYGFSFGAGLILPVAGTDVTIEYSWTETETFDANQFFTAKLNF